MTDFSTDRAFLSEHIAIGKELLYLTGEECRGVGLTRDEILILAHDALYAHGTGDYEMPAKIGVHPFDDVLYHAMPAYVPSKAAVGAKWIACYPRNPSEFGIPQTTGLLMLNDVLSGCPIAVMDSAWLTAMRTPAVTVLAAEKLHPEARSFGMFGCGVQGREHVRFVTKTLKNLESIFIYDVDEEAMDALIAQVSPDVPVSITKCEDSRDLVESCDVMSSATVILKEPLAAVPDDWITPGQTILSNDLNTFWDPRTSLRADRYIVDSRASHALFADMGYFPEGLPEIDCETGAIIAGREPGRTSAEEIIVCSNIGMAVCDMVLGRAILDRALEKNIGTRLPL